MKSKVLFFLLLVFTACTEKVTIDLEESYERLVVDGFISENPGPQRITLTKTSGYFYNAPAPKVVNAIVSVSDGSDVWTFDETLPGTSGVYESHPGFRGVRGKTYTVSITLDKPVAGETRYESTCLLNPVTKLDSVKAVFEPDWGTNGFWLIKIYAKDPADEVNHYMLNLYKNGVLWSDTITKISVSDDQFFNGTYLNGVDVWYIDNENEKQSLKEGDSIRVELSAITTEYQNFVQQVQQAGFNIPFFSGPPANVQGNINNNGAGFFYAYSSSFASSIVKK